MLRRLLGATLLLACSQADAATYHYDKFVTILQAAPANAHCFYFQLAGVTAADSAVVAGNPFFAIPDTHPGYQQIYALLLSAKLAGQAVSVATTGTVAGGQCGNYAGVHEVFFSS